MLSGLLGWAWAIVPGFRDESARLYLWDGEEGADEGKYLEKKIIKIVMVS